MRGWDGQVSIVRRLRVVATAFAAAGIGVILGIVTSHLRGSAHLNLGFHQGAYTYGSSNCDTGSRNGPVNLVFYGVDALAHHVREHASYQTHGDWDDHSGDTHYFLDHGLVCQIRDDQSASAGWFPTGPVDRYHMRYNSADINGLPDWDVALGGLYTLGSAHYEDGGLVCNDPPW